MRIENPRSEQKIIEDNLWPKGEYDFEITEGEDSESQKGNDMIVLTLNVYNAEGKPRVFKDWLVEAFPLKLRRCAEACDLLDDYKKGEIKAFYFRGRSGKLSLGVGTNKHGDPCNVILDYVTKNNDKTTKNTSANDLPDDDLPF